MRPPNVVANMSVALQERMHPAITRWNRLEGRPRTHDFQRALRAEVRDACWLLSRQWQLGEFRGDDAGSPALARVCLDRSPIDRFQAANGAVTPLDTSQPLEAKVEPRPLPLRAGAQYLSLDLRLLVGRRWLKLLAREAGRPDGLTRDYRADYVRLYGVARPDPLAKEDAAICAHVDAWQLAGAVAGALDGIALLEYIAVPGHEAFDDIGAAPADEPRLAALARRLDTWFADLILRPSAPAGDAWLPERLEYQFGCSAPDSARGGEREYVMRASEYYHGHLDWYAVDHERTEDALGEAVAAAASTQEVHTFVPAPIVFEGMPDTRWWAFEDRRTNFGEVRPDTTDLGKLLLLEFGLLHANDWFVFPYTLPIGTVVAVRGIAVTDVFGERFWVEPVQPRPADEWQWWNMFTLSTPEVEHVDDRARLVLLPTVPKIQESEAVEQVALIRDEVANLVWGIEQRIPLPSGAARPGREAAREHRDFLERLAGEPAAPVEPAAAVRYRIMNTVPENWIPFIPVHVDGSVREMQLQRAALPRIIADEPVEKVRPRTTLLSHNIPRAYYIHEEEVPRAGVVVRHSYQRTRWTGGRVFTWLGARKLTGRGEGSSGLRFDTLVEAPPTE